jgi:hypothetical protein
VAECTGGNTEIPNFDMSVKTRSGERLWINMSTIVSDNQRTGRRLLVHMAHDITEQKKNEELMQKMLELSKQRRFGDQPADPPKSPSPHQPETPHPQPPGSSNECDPAEAHLTVHVQLSRIPVRTLHCAFSSHAKQQDLQEKFEDVEREGGEDVHAGFEMLAKKLEAVVEYRNTGACPLCSSAA